MRGSSWFQVQCNVPLQPYQLPTFGWVQLTIMAADQPVDGVDAEVHVPNEAVAQDAAAAAAAPPAEQGATDVPDLGMC